MRVRLTTSLIVIVAFVALAGVATAKTFKMKTTVKDHVTTKWTLECPDGKIDLTKVSLTDDGIMEFFDCLNDIEASNGIMISSKTKVKDFVVQEDIIQSTTEMTEEQAQKLCDIIEDNRIPEQPIAKDPPRIQTLTCNGAVESILLFTGDGGVVDLLNAVVDPVALQNLLDLIAAIEANTGVHIAGETTTADGTKDRVRSVAYLSGQELNDILNTAQATGIGIPPDLSTFPLTTKVRVDVGGQKDKVDLTGHITLLGWPPLLPIVVGQPFQVEIVEMQLSGSSPVLGNVDIGPAPIVPLQGEADPLKSNVIELRLPTLAFSEISTDAGPHQIQPEDPNETSNGRVKLPLRRDPKLKIKKKRDLFPPGADPAVDDPAGSIKFSPIRIEIPAHIPVLQLPPP